jgi:hypothetical protein
LITKWASWLGQKSHTEQAEQGLAEITDPRALRSVWSVFVADTKGDHARAVQVLGQIDAPGSSRALAWLSVFDNSSEVRRAATETLKRRDPREFAGMLVALLRDRIKYEVKPVGGPGSPGALFVAGRRFNVQRQYAPPPLPNIGWSPSDRVSYDANGLPVVDRILSSASGDVVMGRVDQHRAIALAEIDRGSELLPGPIAAMYPNGSQINQQIAASNKQSAAGLVQRIRQQVAVSSDHKVNVHRNVGTQIHAQIPIGQMALESKFAAAMAQQQLRDDVEAIEVINDQVGVFNDRVAGVLNAITGHALSADAETWKAWWVNQLGYRSTPPQETAPMTIVENVPLSFYPQTAPTVSAVVRQSPITDCRAVSCFGAGTRVRTLDGPRAIESLKVGDQILTQSVKTGALGYEPVLVVHHNPPSPTFLVKVNGDTIVSSPFHRFWVAGRGWIMARDLKGGESLRLLDGLAKVDSVETGEVQPVFNLDVAEDHDFFAGAAGALVHDNTLPDTRLVPFDAAPELTSVARRN